jgi:allophanate hydrolase subunit 2
MTIEIIKPAASMLPQRHPMDPWAGRILHLVLGHNADILECTLTGPILRATARTILAIGAPEGALPYPVWEPIHLSAGEELDLRKLGGCSRIYLALASDSTSRPSAPMCRVAAGSPLRASKSRSIELSWVADDALFSDTAFQLLAASDRRGLRYAAATQVKGGREIPPEPMTYGAVQLPPSGNPIIVGPDGPLTGGYQRIATVANTSLRNLAWQLPGDQICFSKISREAALKQVLNLEDALVRDLLPC